MKDISQWVERPSDKIKIKKVSRRERLGELKFAYEMQQRNMTAQSILWQMKWDSAPNPFIAWELYKKDRKVRKPHVDALLKAKEEYFSFKDKE